MADFVIQPGAETESVLVWSSPEAEAAYKSALALRDKAIEQVFAMTHHIAPLSPKAELELRLAVDGATRKIDEVIADLLAAYSSPGIIVKTPEDDYGPPQG